jgi:hypothetical protein
MRLSQRSLKTTISLLMSRKSRKVTNFNSSLRQLWNCKAHSYLRIPLTRRKSRSLSIQWSLKSRRLLAANSKNKCLSYWKTLATWQISSKQTSHR